MKEHRIKRQHDLKRHAQTRGQLWVERRIIVVVVVEWLIVLEEIIVDNRG